MEKVQDMIDKGEIQYQDPPKKPAVAMVVTVTSRSSYLVSIERTEAEEGSDPDD